MPQAGRLAVVPFLILAASDLWFSVESGRSEIGSVLPLTNVVAALAIVVMVGLAASRWQRVVVLGEDPALLPGWADLKRAGIYGITRFILTFVLMLIQLILDALLVGLPIVPAGGDPLAIFDPTSAVGALVLSDQGSFLLAVLLGAMTWVFGYAVIRAAYGLPEQAVTGRGRGNRASFRKTRPLRLGLMITALAATLVQMAHYVLSIAGLIDPLYGDYDSATGAYLPPAFGPLALSVLVMPLIQTVLRLGGAAILTAIDTHRPPGDGD